MSVMALVRKDASVTNETGWARLHRIANARRHRIGLTQVGVHAAGGPSAAWQRKLKFEVGEPSLRHTPHLTALDRVMGWSEGTSLDLVRGDRSTWSAEMLEAEEHELVEGVDDISRFVGAVELRLRALPVKQAEAAMERIYSILKDVARS